MRWDKGEHFRSGCLWQVGKGRVLYFRPGYETYPIFKAEPLRVVKNAVLWLPRKATPCDTPSPRSPRCSRSTRRVRQNSR